MKLLKPFVFCVLCFVSFGTAQKTQTAKEAITTMLQKQKEAWNNHDIETFMETYWKSEDLKFYGSSGVVKGWQSTLERYQRSYPTKAHFGTLDFVINDISKINKDAYYVLGEYYLTRTVGDTNGIFMLVVKHFEEGWRIIADTSATVK